MIINNEINILYVFYTYRYRCSLVGVGGGGAIRSIFGAQGGEIITLNFNACANSEGCDNRRGPLPTVTQVISKKHQLLLSRLRVTC